MNWKKIFTIAALTGFSASVATGQGTAPTIVQGDYISNVFGQSNFIKNPNAKLNTKDVTVSNATVTRSTTTPLVATSEFNITTSTSTGYADWATRTFDAGMKNQNCEARFTYRGFSVGSTSVQIRQGSNTVAQLTLTASTDPRIASINFPCGDLSSATTLRVQQATASLTGTNEIGGIYLGLATNQANVAQAEAVINVYRQASQSIPTATDTTVLWDTEGLDQLDEYTPATGIYKAKRAGQYLISAQVLYDSTAWPAPTNNDIYIHKNNAQTFSNVNYTQAAVTTFVGAQVTATVQLAVGDEIKILVRQGGGGGTTKNLLANGQYNHFKIYRFPTSSELVVTPERQNVFASVKLRGNGYSNQVTANAWTKSTSASALTRTTFGKAKVETNNDFSITIDNLPVGSYYVTASGLFGADGTTSSTGYCRFGLSDSATGGDQIAGIQQTSHNSANTSKESDASTIGGVYYNSSLASRTFYLQLRLVGGTGTFCYNYTDSTVPLTISVIPLDQPSNSALYVQGPVKAAATGDAIPAGYVGESKSANIATTNITGSVYNNLQTLTLTPGVWLCSTQSRIWRNAATLNANFEFLTCLGASGSASCTPTYTQVVSGSSYTALPTTFNYVTLSSVPVVIRYDGTTLYWADGNTSSSTTGEIFQKVYLDTVSGTPQASGRIDCTRLN